MQREQERERRRLRDRERRQSMTQEQRERHLERRRRNYQLRRQRAANNNNNNNNAMYNNMAQPPESSTGEASTSDEQHPTLLSSSISDYTTTLLPSHNILPHHQLTSTLPTTPNIDGSSVHMETLTYRSTKRLRLNHVRQIARTLRNNETMTAQVAPELIAMGKADLSTHGSTQRSLRLKRVKQLARSLHSPSKQSLAQNQKGTEVEDDNITLPTYI